MSMNNPDLSRIEGLYKMLPEILEKPNTKGVRVCYTSPKSDKEVEIWGKNRVASRKFLGNCSKLLAKKGVDNGSI